MDRSLSVTQLRLRNGHKKKRISSRIFSSKLAYRRQWIKLNNWSVWIEPMPKKKVAYVMANCGSPRGECNRKFNGIGEKGRVSRVGPLVSIGDTLTVNQFDWNWYRISTRSMSFRSNISSIDKKWKRTRWQVGMTEPWFPNLNPNKEISAKNEVNWSKFGMDESRFYSQSNKI